MLFQHQRHRERRKAACEVIHVAVALGLAEDRHDARRIDVACRDQRLDAAHVIGRGGGDAMDFCDGHFLSPSSWPSLIRPSTSYLLKGRQDVDARHEAGHDGVINSTVLLAQNDF